jgi:hypothetical protein
VAVPPTVPDTPQSSTHLGHCASQVAEVTAVECGPVRQSPIGSCGYPRGGGGLCARRSVPWKDDAVTAMSALRSTTSVARARVDHDKGRWRRRTSVVAAVSRRGRVRWQGTSASGGPCGRRHKVKGSAAFVMPTADVRGRRHLVRPRPHNASATPARSRGCCIARASSSCLARTVVDSLRACFYVDCKTTTTTKAQTRI